VGQSGSLPSSRERKSVVERIWGMSNRQQSFQSSREEDLERGRSLTKKDFVRVLRY